MLHYSPLLLCAKCNSIYSSVIDRQHFINFTGINNIRESLRKRTVFQKKNCLDKFWRYRRALGSWVSGWLVLSLTHSINILAFVSIVPRNSTSRSRVSFTFLNPAVTHSLGQHSTSPLLEALLFHLYFRTPSPSGFLLPYWPFLQVSLASCASHCWPRNAGKFYAFFYIYTRVAAKFIYYCSIKNEI